MKAEQRNRRVTLLVPLANSDGHTTGATVWAAWDVKPPRGRQIITNDMQVAEQTRWINVAYSDATKSITSAWDVRYGTKANPDGTISPVDYEIVSQPIDNEMKHEEIYLELRVLS